ncbi:MAG: hypothetical protein K1X89_05750 [Myxococcaceae bacterium]|nr:hypothetical protein [Myxococcaceae bacterium]
MTTEREAAKRALRALGLQGPDVYWAELIPVVETAWADGVVQPNERALLDAYVETVAAWLNACCQVPLFSVRQGRAVLERLLEARLPPHRRWAALRALRALTADTRAGLQTRARVLEWAEAVAAVDGRPVWDARELFWIQALRSNLPLAQ